MIGVLALLLTTAAPAQDCDARQLSKDLQDASPVAVPRTFLKLVECDEAEAAKQAEFAMGKTLYGDEGNQAALQALRVGAPTAVMNWVDDLEPDHRSQSMMWLGEQCTDVPQVGEFFVASAEQKTDAFLKERWYRGMAKCDHAGVRALLKEIVEGDKFELNNESKFGFIEVYARNLGKDSIPHLIKTATELSDPRDIRLVISALGDAANVGSREGINEEAAKDAIAALKNIAPTTHPEAIDQVRVTLMALGDDATAESMVKNRWPDRVKNGTYEWGVAVMNEVTCKNGKVQVYLHHGRLTDITKWPDALEMDVEARVTDLWDLGNAAKKCKGESNLSVNMNPEPLASEEVYANFIEPYQKELELKAEGGAKVDELEEETATFY